MVAELHEKKEHFFIQIEAKNMLLHIVSIDNSLNYMLLVLCTMEIKIHVCSIFCTQTTISVRVLTIKP